MTPSVVLSNGGLSVELKTQNIKAGFVKMSNGALGGSLRMKSGLFVTGACKGPATLPDVINDAKATALETRKYLKGVL
jgi:heterodisulfide reductase subunit A2